MVTKQVTCGVSFEPEIFQALEEIRGNRQHVRSKYINDVLRKEFGLPEKKAGKIK